MKLDVIQCLIILILVSNYSFAQKSNKKNKTEGKVIEQLQKEVSQLNQSTLELKKKFYAKKTHTKSNLEKLLKEVEEMKDRTKLLQKRFKNSFENSINQANQLIEYLTAISMTLTEMRSTGAATRDGL